MSGWAELLKAVAELLKAMAWPIAFGFIIWMLRPGLLAVLPSHFGRRIQVEGFGVKATVDAAEAEQQQAATANPVNEKLTETPAPAPSDRAAINLIEVRLRDELKRIDPGQKEAVLLRTLAQARLEGAHEFIYNRIFGSQIAFLKRLNEVSSLTIDSAQVLFNSFVAQLPQLYTYGFQNWLNFLTSNGLVEQNANELVITEFARDLLVYITQRRLLEGKPL
jgi:hypothetical protein